MVGRVLLAAVAAVMGQGNAPAIAQGDAMTLSSDSALLAAALEGPRLELAHRGTGVALHAKANPAENGCATMIAARAPGRPGTWKRLFRWSEAAWTGTLPDGRVSVAFFEHEGRLPGDRLVFAPADPAAFRAVLARVREACLAARAESERVLSGEHSGSRSCYFARLPGLELVDPAAGTAQSDPARAVVTLLAEETPEAELRILAERASAVKGAGWGRADVAFTIASPALTSMQIAGARFALDGVPIDTPHTIAVYNDTRLRIRMASAGGEVPAREESFDRRLAASERVTVTLLDGAGSSWGVFNFDTALALPRARRALQLTDWSCATAVAAPASAAQWQLAE